MATQKFKEGDPVRNRYTGKIGIYQRAWDPRYTLRRPCDVRYPGEVDPYGREDIAQSEDDLDLVESETTQRDQSNDAA